MVPAGPDGTGACWGVVTHCHRSGLVEVLVLLNFKVNRAIARYEGMVSSVLPRQDVFHDR